MQICVSRQLSRINQMHKTTDMGYDLLGRVILVSDLLSYDTVTYFDERGLKSEVHTSGGAGGLTPQRRTFLTPTTESDQRHLFGQGRPMSKDSSGSGSAWL